MLTKTSSVGSLPQLEIPSFDECVELAEADFAQFCNAMNADSDAMESVYALWCNLVKPMCNYKGETMLCSKRSMSSVWTWDNCFHALGVAKAFPELAFEQFMIAFRFMDKDGAMPDTIKPFTIGRAFTKPPVHGYIYHLLMEQNQYFNEDAQLKQVLPELIRNVNWWLTGRENAPCYWHGNDTGADNATCMDKFPSIQSPCLFGMLAYSCKIIAEIAAMLGENDLISTYEQLAKELAAKIADFFDGEHLFVRPCDDLQPYHSGSLAPYHALIAWELLPDDMKKALVSVIKNEFLCPYGLSSEAKNSSKFLSGQYESYWRGSVWAPNQVLIAKALEEMGEAELAKEIAQAYCKAIIKGGAAENSNAFTGDGNCCAGYSWAAAAYTYFANNKMT